MTKFLWLSANQFGYELLDEAIRIKDSSVEVQGVITLDQERTKTKMHDGIPQERWNNFGVPVFPIDRIEHEGRDLIERLKPDYVLMVGWRQIVPNEVLSLPEQGVLGLHPTKLPRGRGPAPIINQILDGTRNTAVTLMYVNEVTDGGDILYQATYEIDENDHASEVYEKVIGAGRQLMKICLPRIAKGLFSRIPQNESQATVYQPLKGANHLQREGNLVTLNRRIRAVSRPYNGAHFSEDNHKLTIWRAKLEDKFAEGGISLQQDTLEEMYDKFNKGQGYISQANQTLRFEEVDFT
jgi:methionyl-tRNA formyltransferase